MPKRTLRSIPPFARYLARAFIVSIFALVSAVAMAAPVDLQYKAWDQLLQKHVRWVDNDKASQVDYQAFKKDEAQLNAVLNEWSGLTEAEFKALPRQDQMAFLINAYNGFTIQLILTQYPKLKSIKDIGSLFSSPWKKEFFTLLGAKRHLDWIEHEQLRPVYKDPRIHAAVNCASIGCPALLNKAFTGKQLDSQLEEGFQRFLSDPSRNRATAKGLEVSMIFKWFSEDFESGYLGFNSVKDVGAKYRELLSTDPAVRQALAAKSLPVSYLDYDWNLNDIQR